MLLVIAAQQTRAARTHRHAAVERGTYGVSEVFGAGKSQIVVGREILAAALLQRSQASSLGQRLQRPLMRG
jgi:hypothetical protein